ncbi:MULTISPECIES: hypothetical protein [unclassified Nostoc]|uniref:hypothetical protein n=1 Tax=unclassified Nostoc TaxID=2593658 RepID=UPI00132EC60B|nr:MULTISPECIES: hypothetical protein [unclassified Nostoc]MBD2508667.1 hypothetical protein [Desmonostoc muscorum FACHB-395]QHG19292.1 hypothetical protein GJB62_27265 [Nostoc sp. ATCC 53789]
MSIFLDWGLGIGNWGLGKTVPLADSSGLAREELGVTNSPPAPNGTLVNRKALI